MYHTPGETFSYQVKREVSLLSWYVKPYVHHEKAMRTFLCSPCPSKGWLGWSENRLLGDIPPRSPTPLPPSLIDRVKVSWVNFFVILFYTWIYIFFSFFFFFVLSPLNILGTVLELRLKKGGDTNVAVIWTAVCRAKLQVRVPLFRRKRKSF